MKNLQTLLLILTVALFFTACKKNETQKLWTISGEVQMQDAQTASITTPLVGIKVYLLKAPFTMDTLTNWFTKTDILDSTKTNGTGMYQFGQLLPGDYVVMATDTIAGYRFDWSESPDPVGFTIENVQKEYIVNFTTPEPVMENSESFIFSFNHSGDNNLYKKIQIFRNCRVRFGCGSWWSEPCSWYWDDQESDQNWKDFEDSNPTIESFNSSFFSVYKNATNPIYEYEDIFHIKFYTSSVSVLDQWVNVDHVFTFDISGYDLHAQNVYNVIWHLNSVEVTRTY